MLYLVAQFNVAHLKHERASLGSTKYKYISQELDLYNHFILKPDKLYHL